MPSCCTGDTHRCQLCRQVPLCSADPWRAARSGLGLHVVRLSGFAVLCCAVLCHWRVAGAAKPLQTDERLGLCISFFEEDSSVLLSNPPFCGQQVP